MVKKLFIISFILLIITLVFGGIYYFVFKKGSGEPADLADSKKDAVADLSKEEKKARGKIYALTDEATVGPVIAEDGERIKYYSGYNGNVYQMALDGTNKKLLSSTNLFGLQNIIWSPNQEKVISVFNQEGKTSFSSYDYNERKGKRLADGIANATWNNLGDKIIYQYHDAGKKTGSLSIADPDGKNWQNLAATGLGKVSLAPVPQTTYLSFWNYPNAYEETALETVNFTGGEVKKIFSGKYGADYLWSPNGKKILVSSSDAKGGSKMMLATANENGGEYQNLNIPTMVSKCVWSSGGNKVYYALPGAIDPGTILPNDYQSKKITTQDTFWEVDVTNGKQERLIELNEMGGSSRTFDAGDLFLSPDEDILFFINRTDGKLYRIDI